MSNVRGKGGKLIGEGRGVGVDGDVASNRQGGKGSGTGRGVDGVARDDTVWLARDIRETGGGDTSQAKLEDGVGPGLAGDMTA